VIHDATGGVQSTVVFVPDYNAHRGYPYGYGYYPYPYPYYYHWEWTWMPDVPKPPMMTFKIRMEPKTSRVYVDGKYMGLVDDFDSTGQSLKLPVETFRIRIVHPDGRACAVDVAPIDTSTKTRTILCAFPPQ
jgi:hypothetical protein